MKELTRASGPLTRAVDGRSGQGGRVLSGTVTTEEERIAAASPPGTGPLRAVAEDALADLRGALRLLGLPGTARFDEVTADVSSCPVIEVRMTAQAATDLAALLRHAHACVCDPG